MKVMSKQAKTVLSLGYANYQELYLDWTNNFLTISGFADYHHIPLETAVRLIDDANYLYKQIK